MGRQAVVIQNKGLHQYSNYLFIMVIQNKDLHQYSNYIFIYDSMINRFSNDDGTKLGEVKEI
jgi:hypothetical protein